MDRILVVDDSPFLHSIFRVTLRRYGDCQVSFAKNGMEALATLDDQGEPDLILLDINMPVMDGLEFMRELGRNGVSSRVPVIIISTEGTEDDVMRGLEAGARGYLRKPFTALELHDIISRVVEQQRAVR